MAGTEIKDGGTTGSRGFSHGGTEDEVRGKKNHNLQPKVPNEVNKLHTAVNFIVEWWVLITLILSSLVAVVAWYYSVESRVSNAESDIQQNSKQIDLSAEKIDAFEKKQIEINKEVEFLRREQDGTSNKLDKVNTEIRALQLEQAKNGIKTTR